jgi:hypothetical protein
MTLPYSSATSGDQAYLEIEKILSRFGCARFGRLSDFETSTTVLQFEWNGRRCEIRASAAGYAAAWIKENPWSRRMKHGSEQHKKLALEKGRKAVPSILRDWLKGQITAVETGLLTFDDVFMPHMLLPNGQRFIDVAKNQLLPAPE